MGNKPHTPHVYPIYPIYRQHDQTMVIGSLKCVPEGMQAHFPKPITFDELFSIFPSCAMIIPELKNKDEIHMVTIVSFSLNAPRWVAPVIPQRVKLTGWARVRQFCLNQLK